MYTKEDIEKAKQYLDNEGYRTGSNFTLNMVANLMAEYAAKNCVIPAVSGRLSQQSEIVRERLHCHFAKVSGGWNIDGMNAPFMKEFLNEVQKLVDLSK